MTSTKNPYPFFYIVSDIPSPDQSKVWITGCNNKATVERVIAVEKTILQWGEWHFLVDRIAAERLIADRCAVQEIVGQVRGGIRTKDDLWRCGCPHCREAIRRLKGGSRTEAVGE